MSTLLRFPAKILRNWSGTTMALLLFSTFWSCSGLRQVPQGKPLLVDNEILVNGRPSKEDDDFDIIRQRPNKGIGNVRLFLSLYQYGTTMGDNGFGRWLQEIGEAPVYYDTIQRINSASQLGLHYFNNGYYQCEITSYERVAGKKAKAVYEITTGKRSVIEGYELTSTSRFIDSALAHYPRLISKGDPVIAEALEAEQIKLTNFLKDNGYYKAGLGWIYFEIDTTGGPEHSIITGVVDPYIYGGDIERIRINDISVYPNYNYRQQEEYPSPVTTSNGLSIYQNTPLFRSNFIQDQIFLSQGDYYHNSNIRNTYKNLTGLGVFKNVEVDIVEQDSGLIAKIKLEPLPKRSISTGLEGLGNSGSIGVGGNFSWDNRNLFGGGEVLRLSLGGSLTEQRNSTNTTWLIDARELNGAATLKVPGLLIPRSLQSEKLKEWRPRTEIGAKVSYQYRAQEFNRLIQSTHIDYSWKQKGSNHVLTPWQISYVQIDFTADSALAPFLFLGFQNILFTQSSYRYNTSWTQGKKRFYTGLEVESGGHLWNALGINAVASIPVVPFVKGSMDFRAFIPLVHKRELATKTLIGLSQSWNPNSPFVPFEKSFFMGGSNDLRGWTAYHMGPGATSEDLTNKGGYFSAAPIKFVQSAELRFTLHDALKGAVFIDAGNMWLYNKDYGTDLSADQLLAISKGVFHWNQFYKQLGWNTGFGFRYDLEFFIMRADIAMRVYHPGASNRSPWVVLDPLKKDFNISLGIGYPF